jgi:hypothetical protein
MLRDHIRGVWRTAEGTSNLTSWTNGHKSVHPARKHGIIGGSGPALPASNQASETDFERQKIGRNGL